ncbi:unnamed protein product [Schistosoma margrebowiei]|uniref:Uncharacterized protein n=1 Tax=Schistosoma margrebowiei TaxID=48269 RepID=A0A183MJM7_9TREM|nr:unnamed protein product [Schistosoma margrebowiei]
MSISETYPVMNSNPIILETACANNDLSSSQKDDALLSVHEIVAVTAHEQTENKWSSTLNVAALNGAHLSAIILVYGKIY